MTATGGAPSVCVGVVRVARRPSGWSAPRPAPATPPHRPELVPGSGEDLCHLAGDWRILQLLRGHRWSLDDLVTAWFAADVVRDTPPRQFDVVPRAGKGVLFSVYGLPAGCAASVGIEGEPLVVRAAPGGRPQR